MEKNREEEEESSSVYIGEGICNYLLKLPWITEI